MAKKALLFGLMALGALAGPVTAVEVRGFQEKNEAAGQASLVSAMRTHWARPEAARQAVEEAIRLGAPVDERDSTGTMVIEEAIFGGSFIHLIPRLLGYGVPVRNRWGYASAYRLITSNGVDSPDRELGIAQASILLAQVMDQSGHARSDFVNTKGELRAGCVAYLEPWDAMSVAECRAMLYRSGIPCAVLDTRDRGFGTPDYRMWLIVPDGLVAKAKRVLGRSSDLRGHLKSSWDIDREMSTVEQLIPKSPPPGFKLLDKDKRVLDRLLSRASVVKSMWEPIIAMGGVKVKWIAFRPRHYQDLLSGTKHQLGFELVAVTNRGDDTEWRSQILANGSICPWVQPYHLFSLTIR